MESGVEPAWRWLTLVLHEEIFTGPFMYLLVFYCFVFYPLTGFLRQMDSFTTTHTHLCVSKNVFLKKDVSKGVKTKTVKNGKKKKKMEKEKNLW